MKPKMWPLMQHALRIWLILVHLDAAFSTPYSLPNFHLLYSNLNQAYLVPFWTVFLDNNTVITSVLKDKTSLTKIRMYKAFVEKRAAGYSQWAGCVRGGS